MQTTKIPGKEPPVLHTTPARLSILGIGEQRPVPEADVAKLHARPLRWPPACSATKEDREGRGVHVHRLCPKDQRIQSSGSSLSPLDEHIKATSGLAG